MRTHVPPLPLAGLSQAPDCTRDDDVQVLLVVVTDYRGHSASAVVRRRGGDLARLQTAHGELLLEGGKVRWSLRSSAAGLCPSDQLKRRAWGRLPSPQDVLAGTTPGIELEFQCESMKVAWPGQCCLSGAEHLQGTGSRPGAAAWRCSGGG